MYGMKVADDLLYLFLDCEGFANPRSPSGDGST